jgi:hypothetical protein
MKKTLFVIGVSTLIVKICASQQRYDYVNNNRSIHLAPHIVQNADLYTVQTISLLGRVRSFLARLFSCGSNPINDYLPQESNTSNSDCDVMSQNNGQEQQNQLVRVECDNDMTNANFSNQTTDNSIAINHITSDYGNNNISNVQLALWDDIQSNRVVVSKDCISQNTILSDSSSCLNMKMSEILDSVTTKLSDFIGAGKTFENIDAFNSKCLKGLIEKVHNACPKRSKIFRKFLVANSLGDLINLDSLLADIRKNTASILGLDQSVYDQLTELGVIQWSHDADKPLDITLQCMQNKAEFKELMEEIDIGTNPRAVLRRIKYINEFLSVVYCHIENNMVVPDNSITPDSYLHNTCVNDLITNYSMLDNTSAEDDCLTKISEKCLTLPILTLPQGCKYNYYVIEKNSYDNLIDEDKNIARELIVAAYKHKYALILKEIMNGNNNYLYNLKDTVCYNLKNIEPGYTISNKKKLYNMKGLERVTSFEVNMATVGKQKTLLKDAFLKALWLCLEENSSMPFSGHEILLSIELSLRRYLSGKLKSDWFGVVIDAISDGSARVALDKLDELRANGITSGMQQFKIQVEMSVGEILNQINECLSNIDNEVVDKCGIFFDKSVAGYVISRFIDVVNELENTRRQRTSVDARSETEENNINVTLSSIGIMLQAFNHCPNGRANAMITLMSMLINSDSIDVNALDFRSLAACISGAVVYNIAIDVFQFKTPNNGDHHESSSLFAKSIDMMHSQYGLHAPGAGNWFNHQLPPSLYTHLTKKYPNIVPELSKQTRNVFELMYDDANQSDVYMHSTADDTEIARAVRETFSIAINQLFVEKLLSFECRPLLELLIKSYMKEIGEVVENNMPSSPVILKQFVEVIMEECGMLEYSTSS